ncbi:MAG: SPOR domain-containing protein [Trueperaceae bacterium]|nr:SPOR domain-containing protein [Trueperaceae bacterium]
MRVCFAGLVWLSLLAAPVALAQGIAFTVQAIAVSDQQAALDLSRELVRQGFPAYVVRSTGGQGDVYRVRVGAFANRAAAVRYAASMPDVGGARPVPALAEAIPDAIMPWAPRVLWQGPVAGLDVRVAAWPGEGVALRLQVLEPLTQATYHLAQAGEVRSVDAWRVVPLAARPEPRTAAALDVPFVDLTAPAAEDGAGGATPAPAAPPAPAAADSDAGGEDAAGDEAVGAADEAPPIAPVAPVVALVAGPAEVGLWLLRDRSLWPTTWADDGDEVRAAFAASTVQLAAAGSGMPVESIAGASYLPAGTPPPALVVVEVTDRTGRDAGDVRAIGDAAAGLDPSGPPPLVGTDAAWWPPAAFGERVAFDGPAAGPFAWAMGELAADDAFVLLRGEAGSSRRVVAGTPLWGDGRYLLLRDGEDLVLVDFVAR